MSTTSRERVSFQENLGFSGVPPSPPPSESCDWRGVCKKCLQNLEHQGFRDQNLENKGLAAFFVVVARTASALTMICFLEFEVKVGCHMRCGKGQRCGAPTTFEPAQSPTEAGTRAFLGISSYSTDGAHIFALVF